MEMLFLLVILLAAADAARGIFPQLRGSPADEAARRARHDANKAQRHADQAERGAQASHDASQAPTPWPQVVPSNLPPFPSGWTYAEPVPPAVRTRAWQLLQSLWAKGQGSTAVESTGGEWITYRAEITKGQKRGVVAYRTKRPLAPKAPGRTAARPGGSPLPTMTSTSPGLPQPAPGGVAPAPTPSSAGRPTLHQGAGMGALAALSPYVTRVQIALHVVPADGKYGTHTREAVKSFQRIKGLPDDGVVGPATWPLIDQVSTGDPLAWNVQVAPPLAS